MYEAESAECAICSPHHSALLYTACAANARAFLLFPFSFRAPCASRTGGRCSYALARRGLLRLRQGRGSYRRQLDEILRKHQIECPVQRTNLLLQAGKCAQIVGTPQPPGDYSQTSNANQRNGTLVRDTRAAVDQDCNRGLPCHGPCTLTWISIALAQERTIGPWSNTFSRAKRRHLSMPIMRQLYRRRTPPPRLCEP
jgi:hypothetical protein